MTVAEVQAERELGTRLEAYSGRWVAIRDQDVVADAETLGELLEQVEATQEDVEVLRVPTDQAVACFF